MNQSFFSFCCKSHSFNPLTKYTFTFKCTLITFAAQYTACCGVGAKTTLGECNYSACCVYCTTKNKCILNDGDVDFYR